MRRDKKELHQRAEKKEKRLKEELDREGGLGKKDTFAMLVSAFLVFFPISVGVITLLSLFMLWLFKAF